MTISHFSVHVQSHAVVGLGIFLGGELKESKLQVHTTTKVPIAQAILKFVNSIYLSTKKFQLQKKKKKEPNGGWPIHPLGCAPVMLIVCFIIQH